MNISTTTNDPWLDNLHQLLEENLGQRGPSNQELAVQMNMSERQFIRNFRKRIATTPHQYFTKYRLQKAKLLMRSGQYQTAKELSFAVGYKKDSYFSSLFRKEFGISPLNMLRKLGVR